MIDFKTFNFDETVIDKIKNYKYGKKWPVVYIITGKGEAYIGETTNAYIRMGQHLKNERKSKLNTVTIISSDNFNKSVILDIEAFLIKYISADGNYMLQNGNLGLQFHNYFGMEKYQKQFKNIWNKLRNMKLVKQDLLVIENSNLFKYSPYKLLTDDQYETVNNILSKLSDNILKNKECTFLVNGGAGTGKTILAIYLMKLIAEIKDRNSLIEEQENLENFEELLKFNESLSNLKIGLVIPMDNLRATLKKVFKSIDGLNSNMVLSPNDVAKSTYDLLIVDEAHRLRRRKNLTQYASFDLNNERLNLGKEGTELDWIKKCSKYQILFYDKNQSIKPTDVRKEEFEKISNNKNNYIYHLTSQLRCKGGNDYIEYINSIFSDNPPEKMIHFPDNEYEFYLYDDVKQMTDDIKKKDKIFGLSRNLAGYAWKWKTKKIKLKEILKQNLYDIEINNAKYIWNSKYINFINSKNSINEIGCIHTSQGFDLNFAGIIIGNDIKYDKENKKIIIDKSQYFDVKGKNAIKDIEELKEYIINIYSTLLTRGISGTYVYVCNEELKEYLNNYIPKKSKID